MKMKLSELAGTPKRHNYVRKIEKLMADGKIPRLPGLGHLHIYHDAWCVPFMREGSVIAIRI